MLGDGPLCPRLLFVVFGAEDLALRQLGIPAWDCPCPYAVRYLLCRIDVIDLEAFRGAADYAELACHPRYEGLSTYIGSIRPDDAPAETYNKFINASNKHLDMADPKEVKDFVLTGPPVPAEFTAVTVYPTGAYDPVEAVPAS
jgi:hypothetical protein